MTPISLAMSMLSPSPLIILLLSWLMWGCLFNLANARLGLYLTYFLGLSPLSNFIASLVAIGSLVSLLALFPPFHFFCKMFYLKMFGMQMCFRG
jgi:Na+/melibiose symporter-like transporter